MIKRKAPYVSSSNAYLSGSKTGALLKVVSSIVTVENPIKMFLVLVSAVFLVK